MTARIGLAIIGAGRMGSNHVRLIAAGAPELRIVAIGDVDGGAATRLADEIGGVVAYADPLDAIGALGVDAVLIAVSSIHHRTIVEAAARVGRHILCEKPLALDLDETDAIIAATEQAGVQLAAASVVTNTPAPLVAATSRELSLANSRTSLTSPNARPVARRGEADPLPSFALDPA